MEYGCRGDLGSGGMTLHGVYWPVMSHLESRRPGDLENRNTVVRTDGGCLRGTDSEVA